RRPAGRRAGARAVTVEATGAGAARGPGEGGAGWFDGRAHPDLDPVDVWERHAAWWQQGFTSDADVEYRDQILPIAAGMLAGASWWLDLGRGEGPAARLAAARGAREVVGDDVSAAQLAEARRRGGGVAYVRAAATALPLASANFAAVVCCLVLEHVDDV